MIRVLLVPATMKVLGRANWWAPAPLRRFHRRHGFEDEGDLAPIDTLEPVTPGVEHAVA